MNQKLKFIFIIAITAVIFAAGFKLVAFRLNNPPFSKGIEKQEELIVNYTKEEIPLEPEHPVWKKIKATEVHLFPQSARVPYGLEERDLLVKGLYNDKEIAFLLEYKDSTENRLPPANPDACAILFVPSDGPPTKQMMGFGSIANAWQWLADRDLQKYKENQDINPVRELVAQGPGTQKPMKFQFVDGRGFYKNETWKVIFKRELKSKQEEEFDFKNGFPKDIAFAIWDGNKMESFSKKSISILRKLIMEAK